MPLSDVGFHRIEEAVLIHTFVSLALGTLHLRALSYSSRLTHHTLPCDGILLPQDVCAIQVSFRLQFAIVRAPHRSLQRQRLQ